jgi:hypothetical protein
MKNSTLPISEEDSFSPLEFPISSNPRPARQCTVWVDANGLIQDSDGNAEEMFGNWSKTMNGRHISILLPDLAHISLLTDNGINSTLLFRCHCSIPFRGINRNGDEQKYMVLMNLLSSQSGQRLGVTIRDSCR